MMNLSAIVLGVVSASISIPQDVPKDRAKIVEIIRETILNDPELLQEALNNLAAYQLDVSQKKFEREYNKIKSDIENNSGNIIGNGRSDKLVVVFSDFNCKFCAALSSYIKKSKDVDCKFLIIELPILGGSSEILAKYAIVSAKFGVYNEYYSLVFSNPHQTEEDIRGIIDKLGLQYAAISKEVDKPWVSDIVAKNRRMAASLGIAGTPTLIYQGKKLENGMVDLPEILGNKANAANPL